MSDLFATTANDDAREEALQSPELAAALRRGRALGVASLFRGAAGMLAPGSGPVSSYIPLAGAGASAYNFLNLATQLPDIATHFFIPHPTPEQQQRLSTLPSIPQLPGHETTERVQEEAQKRGDAWIPGPVPENPTEEIGATVLKTAGALAVPTPAVGSQLSKLGPLGKVAAGALHTALPYSPGVGLALGGAAGFVQDRATEGEATPGAQVAAADPQTPQTPAQPPTLASLIASTAQAAEPSTRQDGQPTVNTQNPNTASTLTQLLQHDANGDPIDTPPSTLPPAYNAQGESNWTWGEAALTLGAILAAGAGARKFGLLGRNVAQFERASRAGQVFMADSAEFNAATAARKGGSYDAMLAKVPEAPLPGAADTLWTKTQTYAQDSNAQAKAWISAISQSPDVAAYMRHQIGNTNNSLAWTSRLAEQIKTGIEPSTGQAMPPMLDWYKSIDRLSPMQKDLLNGAMWSADELNNRELNFNRAKAGGTIPADDATRHNLFDWESGKLRALVSAASYDPEVQNVINTYRQANRAWLNNAVARGYLTQTDRALLLRDHPDYIPSTDQAGLIEHAFGPRDTTAYAGVDQIPTKAWDAIKQHHDEFFRQMELNDMRRNVVGLEGMFRAREPGVAPVFVERDKPPAVTDNKVDKSRSPVISIRTSGGIKYYDVTNADMLDWIRGSPTKANVAMTALGYMRQLYQRGTTGVLSLVNGNWFAPKQAIRTALLMPIDRPQGFVGGPIESMVQAATGHTFRPVTAPLDAIANIPGAAFSAGADATADFVNLISDTLHPQAQNPMNLLLRTAFDGATVDAWAQKLQAMYLNTARHEMKAAGFGHVGSQGASEAPVYQIGGPGRSYSPANNMVPSLFRGNSLFGRVLPWGIKTTSFLGEINSIINDSGHSLFYRLNRSRFDTPHGKQTLISETRQLTGDPGVHGSGTVARVASGILPYSNIMVQDNARLARVAAESPVAGAASLIIRQGTLAAASILTAMMAGPDAVQYLQEKLASGERASDVILFFDPDPTKAMHISLAQRERGLYPFVTQFIADGIGAWHAHEDEDTWHALVNSLGDLFSHHIDMSTIAAGEEGLLQNFDPLMLTAAPAVQAVGAAAGVHFSTSVPDLLAGVTEPNQSLSDNLVRPTDGKRTIPNEEAHTDILTGTKDGERIANVFAALLGVMGSSKDIIDQGIVNWRANHDPLQAFGTMANEWKQRFEDHTPMFNGTLWNNSIKLTTRNQLAENVQRSMDAIRPTLSVKSDMLNQGYTRAGGQPLPGGAPTEGKTPTDPLMFQLYTRTAAYGQYIERHYAPQVADLRKVMSEVGKAGGDAESQRQQTNGLQVQLNHVYEEMSHYISTLNADLGDIVGKNVDVRSIDWHRGPEQFH